MAVRDDDLIGAKVQLVSRFLIPSIRSAFVTRHLNPRSRLPLMWSGPRSPTHSRSPVRLDAK